MKTAILILSMLLLLSNAFWLYRIVDAGVTLSYKNLRLSDLEETRKQLTATFQEIAKEKKKVDIVQAASKFTDQEVFEKDGCTWVGWLGFIFDADDTLTSVSPTWSYGDNDPCFPAE